MKIQTITADKAADKFQFLAFNRPVSPSAVRALRKSIERNGIIRPVTVIATSALEGRRGWYVADGQHLLTALIQEGHKVPYVTIPVEDLDKIYSIVVELNTTAKSWTTSDYVRLWAASGKPEYKKLMDLVVKTDLTVAQISVLMTGNRRSHYDIQHGTFKFFRKKWGLQMVDEVNELRSYMFMNSDIALGYYNFRINMNNKEKNKFDIQNFISKLTHAKMDISKRIGSSSYHQWEENFEKIWGNN